jgi:hypothetical protein
MISPQFAAFASPLHRCGTNMGLDFVMSSAGAIMPRISCGFFVFRLLPLFSNSWQAHTDLLKQFHCYDL